MEGHGGKERESQDQREAGENVEVENSLTQRRGNCSLNRKSAESDRNRAVTIQFLAKLHAG